MAICWCGIHTYNFLALDLVLWFDVSQAISPSSTGFASRSCVGGTEVANNLDFPRHGTFSNFLIEKTELLNDIVCSHVMNKTIADTRLYIKAPESA